MNRRENTFRIDHSTVPRKPSFDAVHEFVGTALEMKHEEVIRLQCSRSLGCAFVKASDLETAQRIVEEHDNRHDLDVDNKLYRLRLRMEDGAKEVKLYDLSENVTDDEIVKFLLLYGDVLSVSEEMMWGEKYRFGQTSSGVRIVRMMVKKNIPSNVIIDGELTAVSYHRQRQTCRHCGEFGHSGISCVQNKKLLIQKLTAEKSYASVIDTGITPTPKPIPGFIKPKSGPPPSSKPTQQKSKPTSKSTPKPISTPIPLPLPLPTLTSTPPPTSDDGAPQALKENNDVFKKPSQPVVDLRALRRTDDEETDGSASSISTRGQRRKKMRHDTAINEPQSN